MTTGRKLLKFKNTICDKKSAELELKKYVAFIGLVSEKGRLSIYFDVGTTFYFLIFWFFFLNKRTSLNPIKELVPHLLQGDFDIMLDSRQN